MYDIEFTEQAKADLQWLRKTEQSLVLDQIEANLRYEPTVETRNRKRLRPNSIAAWELRIGKFRVLYHADELILIVSIERIRAKQEIRCAFKVRRKKYDALELPRFL